MSSLLESEFRCEILTVLRRGERSAGDIASELGVKSAGLSYQLARLADAGFLHSRTEGARRFYRLDETRVLDAWQDLLQSSSLSACAP